MICLYSTLESRYYIVALQPEKKLKRYLDQGRGIDGHLLGELGNDVQADKCAGTNNIDKITCPPKRGPGSISKGK